MGKPRAWSGMSKLLLCVALITTVPSKMEQVVCFPSSDVKVMVLSE